jgi:hypothetical protein
VELGVENQPSTLFCVASVNKPLTQIVALRLLESGQLRLSDSVDRWIPGFAGGDEITVEQLLRHRAGIPHRVTSAVDESEPMTAEEVANRASSAPRVAPPGEREVYSSAGYSVLARVLEVAGGQPFDSLLEDQVLRPAGAVRSRSAARGELIAGRADGYYRTPAGPVPAKARDLSFLVGAGALYSTPRELLGVVRALADGVYGERVRSLLITADGGISWNGFSDGYTAFVEHREAGVTAIFAGSLQTGAADRLRAAIAAVAAGEEPADPEPPRVEGTALPVERRASLEGRYDLGSGSVEMLRWLSPAIARLGDWVLVATGDDRFFSPQDYQEVRVVPGSRGAPVALDWGPPEWGVRFPMVPPPAER